MSDLRKAAQQALEALEWHLERGVWGSDTEGVASALRDALAQQPEPVWVKGELPPRYIARSPIQPEPVQEPVAWIQPDHLQKARVAPFFCRVEPTPRCADFVPLYTAPPQRPPLTDEEIAEVYREWDVGPWANIAEFARAIERKVRGETE